MNFRIDLAKLLLEGNIQSTWIFMIFHLLARLQLLSLPLYYLTEEIEESSFIPVFIINKITRGIIILIDDFNINQVLLVISIIYMMIQTLFWALAIFLKTSPLNQRLFITKGWTILCHGHIYFASYLVFAVLLREFNSCLNDESDLCFSASLNKEGMMIVVGILIGLNMAILFFSLYLITPGMKIKSYFSVKNSVCLFIESFEKIILILMIYFSLLDAYKEAFAFFNFILCAFRIYFGVIWMPYWNVKSYMLEVVYYGPNLVLCTLNVLSTFADSSPAKSYLFLWVTLIPISIKIFSSMAQRNLYDSLAKKKNTNPWFLVGRKYLISYLTTEKLNKKGNFASEHQFKIWANGIQSSWSDYEIYTRKEVDFILHEYELMVRNYPKFKPMLYTYFNLLMKYEPSNLKVYDLLKQAEIKYPDFRTKTVISYLKDLLKEKINNESQSHLNSSNLESNKYIEVRNLMLELKKEIGSQINLQTKFWGEYCQNNFEFLQMLNYSDQIENQKKKVSQVWRKFESLDVRQFQTPSIMYSIYLTHVNNQPSLGLKIAKKLKAIKTDLTGFLSNETLFQDQTISVFISGQKSNLGHITDISRSCERLLGFKKADVVGLNIKAIQPSFFSCRHDQKLATYFNTGQKRILNVVLFLYVYDSEGYIRPGDVIAAQNPFFVNDLNLIGLIRLSTLKREYILVKSDGMIDGYTKGLKSIISSKGISIFEISRNFLPIIKMMNCIGNKKQGIPPGDLEKEFVFQQELYHAYFENGTRINLRTTDRNSYMNFRIKVDQFFVDKEYLNILILDDVIDYYDPADEPKFETFVKFDAESDYNTFEEDLSEHLEESANNQNLERTTKGENNVVKKADEKFEYEFNSSSGVFSSFETGIAKNQVLSKKISMKIPKATSSVKSSFGVTRSKDKLEKVIRYVPPKFLLIVFKNSTIFVGVLVLFLVLLSGIVTVQAENKYLDIIKTYDYGYARLDNLVLLQMALSEIKLAITGIHGNNTNFVLQKYSQQLELILSDLLDSNVNFQKSLGALDEGLQNKFFDLIPIKTIVDGKISNETVNLTSFALFQQSIDISLQILNSRKDNSTSNYLDVLAYLHNNLYDSILINSEKALDSVAYEVISKMNQENDTNKIIMGVGITVLVLLTIFSFGVLRFLNQSIMSYSFCFTKLSTHDAMETIKFLEFISAEIQDEGTDGLAAIENKSSSLYKTKSEKAKTKSISFHSTNITSSLRFNFVLVAKIWPLFVILLVSVIVMTQVSINSTSALHFYQKKIESSWLLTYASDVAFASTVETIKGSQIGFIGTTPMKAAEYWVDFSTDTNFWAEKFTSSSFESIYDEILYSTYCFNPKLALEPGYTDLCIQNSGGTEKLGLIQIMTIVKRESEEILQRYLSSSMTQGDTLIGLNSIYNTLEKTNKLQDHYLKMIHDIALSDFKIELEYTRSRLILWIIIFDTIILATLYIAVRKSIKQMFQFCAKARNILNLIPLVLIMNSRVLKDYLIRNSGKMGQIVKNMS